MTAVYALILFGAPAVSFWLLVPGLDPIGRLVVTSLASLCTVSGIAGVMLITGIWSPIGGFAAVLLISALIALAPFSRLLLSRGPNKVARGASVTDEESRERGTSE